MISANIRIDTNVVHCADVISAQQQKAIHTNWQCLINVPYRLFIIYLYDFDVFVSLFFCQRSIFSLQALFKWTIASINYPKKKKRVGNNEFFDWKFLIWSEIEWSVNMSMIDTESDCGDNKLDDELKMIIVHQWHAIPSSSKIMGSFGIWCSRTNEGFGFPVIVSPSIDID